MINSFKIWCIFLGITFIYIFSNCSVLTFSTAVLNNKDIPPTNKIDDFPLLGTIKKNALLEITYLDGSVIKGNFIGIKQYENSEYINQYNNYIFNNAHINIPALGDTIFIYQSSNKIDKVIHKGFEPYALAYSDINSNQVKYRKFSGISEIRNKNTTWSQNDLLNLFGNITSSVPTYSYIRLKVNGVETEAGFMEITSINKINQKSNPFIAFCMGLPFDVGIILLLNSLNE